MEIEVIWCAAWKSWPLFDNSTSTVSCVIWCCGPTQGKNMVKVGYLPNS